MREFTIDKSKWRCGGTGKYRHGEGITTLLNTKGFMCCLGMISEQCGIVKKELMEVAEPIDLPDSLYDKIGLLINDYAGTALASDAMEINDKEEITNTERIKQLKKLFKEHGIKLNFVGKFLKGKS